MPEVQFFTLTIEGVSAEMHVVRFRGHEALSELYEFQVDFVSDDTALDFDSVVGKPVTLEMAANDGPRWISGIVSRIEEGAIGRTYTNYSVTIVPALWTLGLKNDCCIWQDLNIPDVVKDVLESGGLSSGSDFAFQLKKSYSSREYVVQYRETDLAFARRLLEEVGIYFFFEHTEDGHKLVMADDPGEHQDIGGDDAVLPYRGEDAGMESDRPEVNHLRYIRSLRTGKVAMLSYNFQKNKLKLEAESAGKSEDDHVDFDYDGRYVDESTGKSLAEVRQESYAARRRTITGHSTSRHLTVGYKFAISDHPRDDFNGDYVLTRVSHLGEQPQAAGPDAATGGGQQAYVNQFEAIPADVPFRPLQLTERALVDGPQTAVVTGPSGEEIHCDAHGRVKVHFHWDHYGKADDKSSCWVRVSQSHRGSDLAIPRVGEEVIVEFLEGDPDQPIVTGRVYNGGNQSPYALPGDKTKSTFKTLSSPGGNGFNELRFEDASGSEEVFLHAQKDWNIAVGNNRSHTVGNDESETIGHDATLDVKNDRTRKVGANESVSIGANQTVTVGGGRTESVKGSESVTIDGARKLKVGGTDTEDVAAKRTVSIGSDDTLTVGGNHEATVEGNQKFTVSGNQNMTVSGNSGDDVSGNYDVKVGGKGTHDVAADLKLKAGAKVTIEGGDEVTIKCGGSKIVLKPSGIEIKGSKIDVKADGNIKLKGSQIAGN